MSIRGLIALSLAALAGALAAQSPPPVRTVAVESHALRAAPAPGAEAPVAADAADLKPQRDPQANPVFVERVARVGADGTLAYDCADTRRPDLRGVLRPRREAGAR